MLERGPSHPHTVGTVLEASGRDDGAMPRPSDGLQSLRSCCIRNDVVEARHLESSHSLDRMCGSNSSGLRNFRGWCSTNTGNKTPSPTRSLVKKNSKTFEDSLGQKRIQSLEMTPGSLPIAAATEKSN